MWREYQHFKNLNVNTTLKMLLVCTSENITSESSMTHKIQPLVSLVQSVVSDLIIIIILIVVVVVISIIITTTTTTNLLKFIPE